MKLTVRAPATAANLGPGFDTLGLALDLVNEFALEADAEPGVEAEGEGADERADLHPVVFVPEREAVATDMARRALPELVPLADASFNVGRAALAVAALTERPELLADALADRLHQPHRLALAPGAASLFHQLQ